MPRVTLTDPEAADEISAMLRERRGGRLATLDRVLLHSPPVAEGWNQFFGAIRTSTTLSDAVREIAMLRVANLNGDWHNWNHHVPLGLAAGLTRRHLDELSDWPASALFDDVQRAVLTYADAMTRHVTVSDAVFDALRPHFDERQLVELTATIASYNLVSRFLVAMGIDREL